MTAKSIELSLRFFFKISLEIIDEIILSTASILLLRDNAIFVTDEEYLTSSPIRFIIAITFIIFLSSSTRVILFNDSTL